MEEGEDEMIDVSGRRVFLSGPMEGWEHNNAEAFVAVHAMLKELGADWVYDPVVAWLREPQGEDHGRDEWMRRSLHELTRPEYQQRGGFEYDLLVSLPWWEGSAGASAECNAAVACGIETCELAGVVGMDEAERIADLMRRETPGVCPVCQMAGMGAES